MNEVLLGDCLKILKKWPDESFDLVVADPPFNIGYEYDTYSDDKDYQAYLLWSGKWVKECVRLLKPRGSMYVVIGDEFAAEMKIWLSNRLHMRNWIVWRYGFGQNCRNKFSRCHCHVLYYVNNPKRFTFNSHVIKVPSDRQAKYGDKRAKDGGKVPDDVWDFSRVCGTFHERTGHPCQLPEALLERIILTSSHPGDSVLDPFCGSGTTAVVAKRLGRQFLTMDVSKKYVLAARARVAAADEAEIF